MANGEIPKTRYHAEVKVQIDGHEARINCFRDLLDEVFVDIARIIDQFPADWKSPAKRELANAQLKADQMKQQAERERIKALRDAENALPDILDGEGEIPICEECGTDEYMELIEWPDRKTGQIKKAWKCQKCQKWHWPGKNGKGR
jgi:hypothetical protein